MTTVLQNAWLHLVDDLLSFHPFCFVQPALLVVVGYTLVRWQMPLLVEAALFGVTCLASVWMVYLVLMRPSGKGKTSHNENPGNERPAEKALVFEQHFQEHLLFHKTLL